MIILLLTIYLLVAFMVYGFVFGYWQHVCNWKAELWPDFVFSLVHGIMWPISIWALIFLCILEKKIIFQYFKFIPKFVQYPNDVIINYKEES